MIENNHANIMSFLIYRKVFHDNNININHIPQYIFTYETSHNHNIYIIEACISRRESVPVCFHRMPNAFEVSN